MKNDILIEKEPLKLDDKHILIEGRYFDLTKASDIKRYLIFLRKRGKFYEI